MNALFPIAALVAVSTTEPLLAQEVVFEEIGRFFALPIGVDDVEITPDGRFAVARDNTALTTARVYDLENPGPPVTFMTGVGLPGGPCQDGVAVTNERAVVIGSQVYIIDLTQAGFSLLLNQNIGQDPRDVVVTPDGTKAVVRGGDGATGGTYIFDLASATQLAFQPGDIGNFFSPLHDWSVDTVVADDQHAVSLSIVPPFTSPTTRITIWDLQPAGGGAPVIAFETGPGTDLEGAPHDLAMAPDGQTVAVRSVNQIARLNLAQAGSGIQWVREPFGGAGPFSGSVIDSIEVTNDAVVTISRTSGASSVAQVDLFDDQGNPSVGVIQNPGDPHDLAVTPDGTQAVVRTSTGVQLWDLTNLSSGGTATMVAPLSQRIFAAGLTGFQAGLDSIVATDTRVIAMASTNANEARLRVFDITGDILDGMLTTTLDSGTLDLEITPDETKAVGVGTLDVVVIDLIGNAAVLSHTIMPGTGGFSWCDGVTVNNDTAIAFGTFEPLSTFTEGGWFTQIDLFNQPVRFCGSTVNSTGEAAILGVTGSADEIDNNLRLVAGSLPSGEFGVFFYGDQMTSVPFGSGNNCIAGQVAQFGVLTSTANGTVELTVDNTSLPAGGGALAAGSSWSFQYLFRDRNAGGPQFNLSDAVTITFN